MAASMFSESCYTECGAPARMTARACTQLGELMLGPCQGREPYEGRLVPCPLLAKLTDELAAEHIDVPAATLEDGAHAVMTGRLDPYDLPRITDDLAANRQNWAHVLQSARSSERQDAAHSVTPLPYQSEQL